MNKIFALMLILFPAISWGGTATCTCQPETVWAGRSGGYDYHLLVYCGNSKTAYVLGRFDDERAKLRYSMALAAQASNKSMIFHYYQQGDAPLCSDVDWSKEIVPNGVGIK